MVNHLPLRSIIGDGWWYPLNNPTLQLLCEGLTNDTSERYKKVIKTSPCKGRDNCPGAWVPLRSPQTPHSQPPPLSLVFHSFPELFSSNHILLSTLYPSSYTNLFFGVILSSRLCVTGLRIKILIHSMHKNAYVLAVQAGIVGMYIAIKIFPQIHTKILFYWGKSLGSPIKNRFSGLKGDLLNQNFSRRKWPLERRSESCQGSLEKLLSFLVSLPLHGVAA